MYFKITKIRNSKGDELERIIALNPAFMDAYLVYGNVSRRLSTVQACMGILREFYIV